VMQLWATLWCRAQTARDLPDAQSGRRWCPHPSWCQCLAVLAPRHLRLGRKAVSCSTAGGSNVDEVSDAIGDRDLGECDLRPDPRCDAPPRLRSRVGHKPLVGSPVSSQCPDWALVEASPLMAHGGGTV
jgi:hypothetical protein